MRITFERLKQRALALMRRATEATHHLLGQLLARMPWRPQVPPPPETAAPQREADHEARHDPSHEAPRPTPSSPQPQATPVLERQREAGAGEFSAGFFKHREGDRHYHLFVPPASAHAGTARPLIVMLHGCKQHAEDFAVGTQMNELAREHGLYVLYPEQPRSANMLRCWNWFKRRHQQRDSGEPAILADLTRAVMQAHAIDAMRVYVAGLSAGGAMAAILGHAYPDLFAAVGVHSGLPRGAAHDVASAVSAMKDAGASDHPWAHESFRRRGRGGADDPLLPLVPTIVFHGDRDTTVHPRNAELVLEAALGNGFGAGGEPTAPTPAPTPAPTLTQAGRSALGLSFTRTVHRDADTARTLAEHWVVHGVGHAWSGGDARGSYTDARGPSASLEMLRFFGEHALPRHDTTEAVEVVA